MDVWELMRARHSVRRYLNQPIEPEKAEALRQAITEINGESGLHIQLFLEEPEAFAANQPHYGSFRGCRNYFVVAGPKNAEETAGYYGEKLVLFAQELGLNTCWVALTYKKGKLSPELNAGEKVLIVIALGYGEDQGAAHKSKPASRVAEITEATPEWFRQGVEAALLAPTAVNQQQFYFRLEDAGRVAAKAKFGPCRRIDLGIVKYHFELGAGRENFTWA